ncbi:lasso RiPP family leader peptide-containing protein [Nonomuraea sp. MG754425]|nr:lasso RiPP family leader peptide-containing protein [Nonomuraea sp. MG754425]MCF6473782.1 lasso RiPP family leader peptide-containing protein [Nonomuraea sp. MG754425]
MTLDLATTAATYEPPTIEQVGDFAELTRGTLMQPISPDSWSSMWWYWEQ